MVTAQKLTLTLRTPFAIAHAAYRSRDTVAVRFQACGTAGHGEAPVVPYYGVTADVLAAEIRTLAGTYQEDVDALEYQDRHASAALFAKARSICSAIEADEATHPFARAAVSEAVLDWAAGFTGTRVSDVLELGFVPSTVTSFTIADRNLEQARVLTLRAWESGARCFKVKCGFPGDAELVAAVRETLCGIVEDSGAASSAPEPVLWADCNGGWRAEEAVERAEALVREGVSLIEEPVYHDTAALQEVARSVDVPVIADESVCSEAELERLLTDAPNAAGCVLKVAKHAGPLTTARMRHRLRETGRRYMMGQMVESSVGTAWGLLFTDRAEWVDLDAPALIVEDPTSGCTARPGFFGLCSEGTTRAGIGAQWHYDVASTATMRRREARDGTV
jgi:L-alanine-DL-glutamate epimerase-like enolase superfamily enzyme